MSSRMRLSNLEYPLLDDFPMAVIFEPMRLITPSFTIYSMKIAFATQPTND